MSEIVKELELAIIAERVERYEDMAKNMKIFTENTKQLNDNQRSLLSVAYKNVVGMRRNAWRIISDSMKGEDSEALKELKEGYKDGIRKELNDICMEVVTLLDNVLIPSSGPSEDTEGKKSVMFYYKMKGDYYRYLCEVAPEKKKEGVAPEKKKEGVAPEEEDKEDLLKKSEKAYQEAMKLDLPPTDPTKLGLALNFSVFYYEIMGKTEEACKLAKKAFDDAIAELDQLKEETYKDSTLIMQLLRDNLTLWTTSPEQEQDNTTPADAEGGDAQN